jgi:hypothetical protein
VVLDLDILASLLSPQTEEGLEFSETVKRLNFRFSISGEAGQLLLASEGVLTRVGGSLGRRAGGPA